ncbi:MAG: TIM barrel protein [Armatimonadetes bacterium]|nr:TIM barrel protein [Armatimonadota bacterium]
MGVSRRDVLKGAAAVSAAGLTGVAFSATKEEPMNEQFKMKFAPHFGMFAQSAGNDAVEQLKFAAGEGFHAWEDNGMAGRPAAEQERIAQAMVKLQMTMGVFVVSMDTAWSPTLTTGAKEHLDKFLADCKAAVDVAKRVNAKWMTVVPGTFAERLETGYQTANVVDALRRACDVFEPHGLVMVLESLNPWRDHPGLFLSKIPQAFEVCRAVDSPSCKILFDMYHQQITEGNIIPNIDLAWSETAYFQIGDNPGRNEPTTGEMNYKNIFAHIHGKGFQGILGMEHGNSASGKEGERKVIDAYRSCEAF